MARPSQQLDQALLRSGRALYPLHGCAGLTQRLVAEHAGVAPGLFHYHFGSKDAFLRTLLQQLYEELFAGLQDSAAQDGPPLARLRRVLLRLAGFVRDQRPLVVRLATDAATGQTVVQDFVRANGPRHLRLVMQLLQQALPPASAAAAPPLAAAVFLLGAVLAPMVAAPGLAALDPPLPGWPPGTLARLVDEQVCSDAAITERCERALAALMLPTPAASPDEPPAPESTRRRRAPARSPR